MKIFCLLIGILFFTPAAFCAEPGIPVGERLVYHLSWMGIPIGRGELWVKEKAIINGKEVVHVVGMLQTNDFLSTIYPVRDEIHSWIDAETLTSVKFEKEVNEGSKSRVHKSMEFEQATHDVISAFYWVRRQPMKPGESLRTTVIADEKEWELEVMVLRRETLELRGWEPVATLLVEPTSRQGKVWKKGRSLISLSDDASKKPLKVIYQAPFGRIVGVLFREDKPAKSPKVRRLKS